MKKKTTEPVKTKIFAYKGNLGATTDLDKGKFLNDPKAGGQLGCVIHVDEVIISKEAKDIIRGARRTGGSFAGLMLTKHSDGSGASIGLGGFGKHHFGTDVEIGRTCDKTILDKMPDSEVEAPQDYKDFIDNGG